MWDKCCFVWIGNTGMRAKQQAVNNTCNPKKQHAYINFPYQSLQINWDHCKLKITYLNATSKRLKLPLKNIINRHTLQNYYEIFVDIFWRGPRVTSLKKAYERVSTASTSNMKCRSRKLKSTSRRNYILEHWLRKKSSKNVKLRSKLLQKKCFM